MKTSLRMISMAVVMGLGLPFANGPVAAQTAEKVEAAPAKKAGKVADITLKRGLLAKPMNTKSEAEVLLAQMRAASAELKALADEKEQPRVSRRAGQRTDAKPGEYKRSTERLRHKERAVGHRESIDKIRAVAKNLDAEIVKLEARLATMGEDAQLANLDLQNTLQKQQQTLQTISNVSKMLHDTAMAIIRKIG